HVERGYLGKKPLFYSTMDPQVLPGVEMKQVGFLMEAAGTITWPGARMSWPLLCLRSLYPLDVHDYRTRALACFFPYMEGRTLIAEGRPGDALRYFHRAGL